MGVDITIVICLYNAEDYIIKTIQSLEEQTFRDFNLLIINDGSTDKSLKIAKDYLALASFENHEIIDLGNNKGTAFARDFALHKVRTPLMMFFDADDIAKTELVKKMHLKIKEDNNCLAVSCHSKYIDANSKSIAGGQFIGPTSKSIFFNKAKHGKLIFMLPPTLFYKDLAIKAGGYHQKGFPNDTKIRYQDLSEDLDLWSRMSDYYSEGKYMITIPEVLFYYRKNTNSLSASKKSLFAMQNKIRYIKFNLKRRRKSLNDITFIDYTNSISKKNKRIYYKKDMSAYYYRESGFQYVNKLYHKSIVNIILSMAYNPKYIFDKIKSNFLK